MTGDRMAFRSVSSRWGDRSTVQFIEHYHLERKHQGLGNELIEPTQDGTGEILCDHRLGGLLKYYRRAPCCSESGHHPMWGGFLGASVGRETSCSAFIGRIGFGPWAIRPRQVFGYA